MTTAIDKRLRGRTRWSSAAKCPRMAYYGLVGIEPEEPSERTKRLWRRGRQLGADVAQDFVAKYGEENVVVEKAVEWPKNGLPLGELHSDVFVKPEAMAVEVKSATSPASILDDAITQLGGEIYFDDDAEIGCLAIVDPTAWRETEFIPVLPTDELQERVEGIARQIVDATKTGEPPCRVCEKPSDGRGRFCPFITHCFADWQPPDPINLDGDIALLAIDLKHAQDAERALKGAVKSAEEQRKELSEQLAGWELQPGREYVGAGVRVQRTHVDNTDRFSLTKARKAGMWSEHLDEMFAPFINASGAHDRWKIELDSSVGLADSDFGSVPWDADEPETLGGAG